MGEEARRTLVRLEVEEPEVADTRDDSRRRAREFVDANRGPDGAQVGLFCCGACSVGYWRNVTAGGFDQPEERLAAGMRPLAEHRDEGGRRLRFSSPGLESDKPRQ